MRQTVCVKIMRRPNVGRHRLYCGYLYVEVELYFGSPQTLTDQGEPKHAEIISCINSRFRREQLTESERKQAIERAWQKVTESMDEDWSDDENKPF